MHVRVAWLVSLLELRVEITVRYGDFISTELMPIWAIIPILVHTWGSIWVFVSPPFAIDFTKTWT